MKMNLKKSVFVVLMLGTLIGYANETTKVVNEETIITRKKAKQSWSIKDSKGAIVYKQNGIAKIEAINSIELNDGAYTLEVEKDFKIELTPILVKNGITTLKRKSATTIFKPVFRKESNKVLVSQLAINSKALDVTIYYEDEIIFKDKVVGGTILGRVYKLRKDIKGDYKVIMKANDRTYINEFSL